jgi:class 3 adenylate cyclase
MGGGRLLSPGSRLGPYQIEAFLARGSTGEVYRAADERLGRAVALKVLPAWLDEDHTARERFLAEARAAAALDHPNVLPVHDAGEQDGTLWIAMRLAEGRDLRELLRRDGPLPPERAVTILAGIAAALDAAHARGILHRDVKPGNILLGTDAAGGHPYLADFGLATAAHGRGLTRTGELLGTIDYVSPEQARGEPLDARSDVFSLAAVLFECLTGVAPFHRATELAALTARLDAPAPAPTSLRPDLPEALDPVLARALARAPADRYPSAGAFMTAARAAVVGAHLRGLLFADLRGYTAFAEREGDTRAAALLARYREVVRGVVARSSGAEVRTEGDSFYVIFPSATAAILAGIAIVGAAAATTTADPSLPLRPGVGVHAGEPLEAPEGPIGSAVNTAARLCSLAAPGEVAGEVLVSRTARDLARGSRDLVFAARGGQPAKGLAEPLEAWAASVARPGQPAAVAQLSPPAATVEPVRAAGRRRAVVAAGTAIAAVLGIVVVAILAARPGGAPEPSPLAGAAAPSASAPLATLDVASPEPAASPVGPAASPPLGPFPTEAEADLVAMLPTGLVGRCERGGRVEDALLAGFAGSIKALNAAPNSVTRIPITPRPLVGITCRPDAGARRLYVMVPSQPRHTFGQPNTAGDEYVGYLAGRWRIPAGPCAAGDRAYERWRGTRGTGLLACMNPYDGRPWIYFSFADGRHLAFATRDDADYDALYAWWEQLRTLLP